MTIGIKKWAVALGAFSLVLIGWDVSTPARAGNAKATTPFLALSAVSVPEMPATAAEWVASASPLDRDFVIDDVLHAASSMTRPGVMPYLVSAICRRCPSNAAAAVSTATEIQPEDVLIFVRAAIHAAPSEVENIVFSACTKAPSHSANVALIACRELPSQEKLILAGFGNALPGLQPFVDQARIKIGTNDSEAVIKQTVQLWDESAKHRAH